MDIIHAAQKALEANNIQAFIAANGEAAKKKVFELIPQGAEVLSMTSVTLDALGISKEINESGKYNSVRTNFLNKDAVPPREKQKMGAAPEWAIGSVHAVTLDGKVIIASNTGSQLPAYAYGANHVMWVVGAQKIVKNLDEGMKRLYEYILPLESERAKKAYGVPGSFISKLLIVNREVQKGRITVILINESLGY